MPSEVLKMVSLLVVDAPKMARTTGSGNCVAQVFERSSDKCPRRSVDTWHMDGHCGRPFETTCFFQGTLLCPNFPCDFSDLRLNFVTIFIGSSETLVRISAFSLSFSFLFSLFSFLFSLFSVAEAKAKEKVKVRAMIIYDWGSSWESEVEGEKPEALVSLESLDDEAQAEQNHWTEKASGSKPPFRCLAEDDEREQVSVWEWTWKKVAVVVDSGAAENVMPRRMFPEISTEEMERSKKGKRFKGPGG